MFNYQIIVEYNGTNFVGWQIQKNGLSIQEATQTAISKTLNQNIILHGSGRTDSGVHALAQSAHFISKTKISNNFFFLNTVNFFLNKTKISILKITQKKQNFHARYSAKKRIYKYLIINRIAPLSLDENKAWHIKSILNTELMKKAAKLLEGTKDFSTYRSSSCGADSPFRTLDKVRIVKKGNKITIIFKSKSFLQQQVRSMVGCLKFVAEGKWNLKKFKTTMNSKKRINCAPPAPARGLYLFKVYY
tara:strand:+ start:69 stop:809 length:741 start_codon:yes stop_codon:yes gene_type:complete